MITREDWGAAPPRGVTPIDPAGKALTIHWEGTTIGAISHDRCAPLVRAIQAAHQAGEFVDIAYTMLVCQHGEVYEGRGWWAQTGANGTPEANRASMSVCYLAGVGDPYTAAGEAGIVAVRGLLGSLGGSTDVWPHRHWVATACPGDDLAGLAARLHGTPFPTIDEGGEMAISEDEWARMQQLIRDETAAQVDRAAGNITGHTARAVNAQSEWMAQWMGDVSRSLGTIVARLDADPVAGGEEALLGLRADVRRLLAVLDRLAAAVVGQ